MQEGLLLCIIDVVHLCLGAQTWIITFHQHTLAHEPVVQLSIGPNTQDLHCVAPNKTSLAAAEYDPHLSKLFHRAGQFSRACRNLERNMQMKFYQVHSQYSHQLLHFPTGIKNPKKTKGMQKPLYWKYTIPWPKDTISKLVTSVFW